MIGDVFRIPDNDASCDMQEIQQREIFVRGGAIAENLDEIEKGAGGAKRRTVSTQWQASTAGPNCNRGS